MIRLCSAIRSSAGGTSLLRRAGRIGGCNGVAVVPLVGCSWSCAFATGTIKRWDGEKGFGFILPEDADKDIFVHRSGVSAPGFIAFSQGESVEFDVVTDPDGRSRAEGVTGPGGGELQGPWADGEPLVGVVARWRSDKGFGFITPEGGGDDVFVHQSAIFASGYRSLVVGETVEYSLLHEGGRTKADRVSAPDGQPIEGMRDDGGYGDDDSYGGGFGGGGGGYGSSGGGEGYGGGYGGYSDSGPRYKIAPGMHSHSLFQTMMQPNVSISQVHYRMFSAKTNNAMRKRFKLTSTGKLKHKGCGNNHKAQSKNRARHNRIRNGGVLTQAYTDKFSQFLGRSTKA